MTATGHERDVTTMGVRAKLRLSACRSGPAECERNDGDAVGTAVGESAGIDDHPVDEAVAELFGTPIQVHEITGSDGVGEFDLDRDRGAVRRLDSQLPSIWTPGVPQVTRAGPS